MYTGENKKIQFTDLNIYKENEILKELELLTAIMKTYRSKDVSRFSYSCEKNEEGYNDIQFNITCKDKVGGSNE